MNEIGKNINGLANRFSLLDQSTDELTAIARRYPYFGFAHLLLARKLKHVEDENALGQVQHCALYFSNPYWLHYLLSAESDDTDDGFINQRMAGVSYEANIAEGPLVGDTPAPLPAEGDVSTGDENDHDDSQTDVAEAPMQSSAGGVEVSWDILVSEETPDISPAETQKPGEQVTENRSDIALSPATSPVTEAQTETVAEETAPDEESLAEQPASTTSADEESMTPVASHDEPAQINGQTESLPSAATPENETASAAATPDNSTKAVEPENGAEDQHEQSGSSEAIAAEEEKDLPILETATRDGATESHTETPEPEPEPAFDEEDESEVDRDKLSRLIEQHLSEFKKPVDQNEEIPLSTAVYHAIDYFASQGIKLDPQLLKDDKLQFKVKKFTDWLKQMKRVNDNPTDLGTDIETEHLIEKIAQTSNETKDVITETMAEVLVKQGKIDKAIQLYQKLSFLNPSKSPYFAAKINNLKV